jgi:hypothetical protein
MNRKLAFSLALLAILMIVSATSMPTQAVTYQLGVSAGNTADYTASITGLTNVTKAHLSVHNATGTVAGLDLSFYCSNGSLAKGENISAKVDVTSTNGSDLGFLFLIAKNLTATNPVYPTATLVINQTTSLTVAGASRTVNRLALGNSSFYWDQATGITVEMNLKIVGWFNLSMTATNMWSSPLGFLSSNMTTILIIVVIVVIVIVAAVVLLRRRK